MCKISRWKKFRSFFLWKRSQCEHFCLFRILDNKSDVIRVLTFKFVSFLKAFFTPNHSQPPPFLPLRHEKYLKFPPNIVFVISADNFSFSITETWNKKEGTLGCTVKSSTPRCWITLLAKTFGKIKYHFLKHFSFLIRME